MKTYVSLSIALAMLFSTVATAETNNAGIRAKNLADTLCITCHGTNGVSVAEEFPNLSGQKMTYLEKQLKDFRDGNRKDLVMNNMAESLDDGVIQELAKLFATAPQR